MRGMARTGRVDHLFRVRLFHHCASVPPGFIGHGYTGRRTSPGDRRPVIPVILTGKTGKSGRILSASNGPDEEILLFESLLQHETWKD